MLEKTSLREKTSLSEKSSLRENASLPERSSLSFRRLTPAGRSVAIMAAVIGTGLASAAGFSGTAEPLEPAYFLEMDRPDTLPPARIWLIDGFNVLHASLGGSDRQEWWKSAQRARLVDRAAQLQSGALEDEEIWVVFDGDDPGAGPTELGRTRTVFARSADDWIVKRVGSDPEPGRIAVVTGDKQVAGRARHRGAEVVSPRTFLAHCARTETS